MAELSEADGKRLFSKLEQIHKLEPDAIAKQATDVRLRKQKLKLERESIMREIVTILEENGHADLIRLRETVARQTDDSLRQIAAMARLHYISTIPWIRTELYPTA